MPGLLYRSRDAWAAKAALLLGMVALLIAAAGLTLFVDGSEITFRLPRLEPVGLALALAVTLALLFSYVTPAVAASALLLGWIGRGSWMAYLGAAAALIALGIYVLFARAFHETLSAF